MAPPKTRSSAKGKDAAMKAQPQPQAVEDPMVRSSQNLESHGQPAAGSKSATAANRPSQASATGNRSPAHAPGQTPQPSGAMGNHSGGIQAPGPGGAMAHPSEHLSKMANERQRQSLPRDSLASLREGTTAPSGNRTRGSRLSRAYDGINMSDEAPAQAHLMLGYPPEAHRAEAWRATIQCLIDYADPSERGGASTPQPFSARTNDDSRRSQRHMTSA